MASPPFLVLSFACNAFSSLAAHLGQAQSSLYSPFLAWGGAEEGCFGIIREEEAKKEEEGVVCW